MRKICAKALSLAALSVLGGSAAAQQPCVNPAPMPAMAMPAQGCGGCGNHWTDSGCGDDCNRGGLYFEASILILKPRWDNNEAYAFSAQSVGQGGFLDNSNTSTNFDMGMDWMPRLVAGYSVGDGFGARVRWSQGTWNQTLNTGVSGSPFNEPAERVTSANPLGLLGLSTSRFITADGNFAAASVAVEGELRVLTWDFEATKEARIAGFNVTFSGGLRYLHISQDYRVGMVSDTADFLVGQVMTSGHNINGVGPTFAIDARAPLGGSIAAYGVFRQSVIFANGTQSAEQADLYATLDGPAINYQRAYQERDTVIPITELEVGGEYTASMGKSELFARAGLVGQVYFGAGNSSRSGNSANEVNSNLGLLGVVFSAGIRY